MSLFIPQVLLEMPFQYLTALGLLRRVLHRPTGSFTAERNGHGGGVGFPSAQCCQILQYCTNLSATASRVLNAAL